MKNACVVLRKTVNATPDDGMNAVLDELFLGGYSLAEIRFLSQMDETRVKEGLNSLSGEYENIFLLADKTALPIIRGYLSETLASAQMIVVPLWPPNWLNSALPSVLRRIWWMFCLVHCAGQ